VRLVYRCNDAWIPERVDINGIDPADEPFTELRVEHHPPVESAWPFGYVT
jgi:hypothetical protein